MRAILAALDAMETWERRANLPNISCPTQIIWGEQDRTYKWEQVELLWNEISAASLAVLPHCSHAAHMENPRLFNQILMEFLDRNN